MGEKSLVGKGPSGAAAFLERGGGFPLGKAADAPFCDKLRVGRDTSVPSFKHPYPFTRKMSLSL